MVAADDVGGVQCHVNCSPPLSNYLTTFSSKFSASSEIQETVNTRFRINVFIVHFVDLTFNSEWLDLSHPRVYLTWTFLSCWRLRSPERSIFYAHETRHIELLLNAK